MKKTYRILALILALIMALGMAACGSKPAEEPVAEPTAETTAEPTAETTAEPTVEEREDTLVVGYSNFSEKFSPFFATSAYDLEAAQMVQVMLLAYDRQSNMLLNGIEGDTVNYNGTDYDYTNIADCVVTMNDDGSVVYDFTLREDIMCSDGEILTADDVIFSFYVNSDPTYDGSATFYSLPIVGMQEYRDSMGVLYKLILDAGEDNTDFTNWTEEQQTAYWAAFHTAGEAFAQEIVDYCVEAGYGETVAECASAWGYTLAEDATAADFFADIFATYGSNFSAEKGINYESAGSTIEDLLAAELGEDVLATYTDTVNLGDAVPNIAGIEKTGDFSVRVTMSEFDATAIYQFNTAVAPMHYYGDPALYDYDNNMFGFPKGDLTIVKDKTTKPMGAGAYKFVSYENGVITFEANENYFKGEPKIKYILFQEATDADKLTGVATGTMDLAQPSFSMTTADSIRDYNGNGDLNGPVLTTHLVDYNGYGYIGICADRVRVGTDNGSYESRCLRKAIATLFAVYRDTVIASYYGDQASVIQYPITNCSWAAPQPADEGYELAYSTDVDGNPIYTDGMTDEEKYAAALDAAIGYIKAAGYTWDEAAGKFTAAPEGAALAYELQIGADGTGDHPSFGIVTNASVALESIGISLQITDLADSSSLWDGLDANTVDMWCAAWGGAADPDMKQVYYSTNISGPNAPDGSTLSNHYTIQDAELDELIDEARTSADTSFRKATYKQCLDIILDWGCEIPTYQRQDCYIYSTERLNIDTITPDVTTYWTWMQDIQNLELN